MKEDQFKKIYKKYCKPLYAYVVAYVTTQEDAQEITANAFIKLWYSKKEFKDEQHLRGFLFMVARNECVNLINKKKRQTVVSANEFEEGATNIHANDFIESINAIVQELPQRQKQIIELVLFEGLNDLEVSMRIGKTEKTIRNLRNIATAKIKNRLHAHNN